MVRKASFQVPARFFELRNVVADGPGRHALGQVKFARDMHTLHVVATAGRRLIATSWRNESVPEEGISFCIDAKTCGAVPKMALPSGLHGRNYAVCPDINVTVQVNDESGSQKVITIDGKGHQCLNIRDESGRFPNQHSVLVDKPHEKATLAVTPVLPAESARPLGHLCGKESLVAYVDVSLKHNGEPIAFRRSDVSEADSTTIGSLMPFARKENESTQTKRVNIPALVAGLKANANALKLALEIMTPHQLVYVQSLCEAQRDTETYSHPASSEASASADNADAALHEPPEESPDSTASPPQRKEVPIVEETPAPHNEAPNSEPPANEDSPKQTNAPGSETIAPQIPLDAEIEIDEHGELLVGGQPFTKETLTQVLSAILGNLTTAS